MSELERSKAFSKAKNLAERLKIAYKLVKNAPEMSNLLENRPNEEENSLIEASKNLRAKGNKLYGSKSLKAASIEYTKASIQAPAGSKEAALALGNRSAVLAESERFQEAVEDINVALDHFHYPLDLQFKLFERKGKCLSCIGKDEEAKWEYEKALKALK